MKGSLQSSRARTYPRRTVLRRAGGAALGALAASSAVSTAYGQAASAATVLFANFGFTCEAPIFVAAAQGYFKDEGLNVTLTGTAGPPENFARFKAGTGHAAMIPAFALVPQWLPPGIQLGDAVATAGLERGCFALVVAADSPYRAVADLKGQKVAAAGPLAYVFGEAIANAGLDTKKDIDWQPPIPYPGVAAALANKTVAAALAIEPLASTLLASGAVRALLVQDRPPMMMDYCCSAVLPGALVSGDRSKAAALTRALMRGSAWAAANPAAAAQMEVDGKHVQATLAANQNAIGMIAFAPSVASAQANTRDVLGRAVKLGFLDAATDVPALMNRIFMPVTGELAAQAPTQLPRTGGAPLAASLGAGLALLGLGLLARRAARDTRDETESS
jgi:NitT/TauT family transport system substrate-binding protein